MFLACWWVNGKRFPLEDGAKDKGGENNRFDKNLFNNKPIMNIYLKFGIFKCLSKRV